MRFFFKPLKVTQQLSLAMLLSVSAAATHAHQVWVERSTQSDPAQVYFGEMDEARPDEGESVQKLVSKTRVFGNDPQKLFKTEFKQNHIEAHPEGRGDVRMISEQIWAPFKNKEGLLQTVVFNSRAGRTETAAVLDLELVPSEANSNTMTLFFQGKPLADKDVTVLNPELWKKTLKTDAQGRITVPVTGKGRYRLLGNHQVNVEGETDASKVQSIVFVTSLSFFVD